VHTDQGLVPIEKVRVGTRVLSQPEEGGEQDYRAVINTMAHLDQQVYAVQVKVDGADTLTTLIATPNHPFWVESPLVDGAHWMATECLQSDFVLQLADGRKASVHAAGLIRSTQYPNIGFAADDRAGVGMVLNLKSGQIGLADDEASFKVGKLEVGEPYLTPVYNFEVEEFHTYYVGDTAVWVHNSVCEILDPVEAASRKAERDTSAPTCFPIDTYVMTNGGMVAEIDRIGVGTLVLSRCEKTGEQAYKRVTKKFEHSRENWDAPLLPTYKIKIVTAEGKRDGLEATAEHPFWVNGIGWVPAHELQPGQMLEICDPLGTDDCDRPVGKKTEDMILSGRRWQAEVVSVEQDTGSPIVYNIEVEDFHTYFVGVFGVWVHNKNQSEPVFTQELKMSDENAIARGEKNRRSSQRCLSIAP
jgi:hypothetical protein